jgi:pyruvate dehydrogenase E1 component beta subunit
MLASTGIEVEVIDLRYLWPVDYESVRSSLEKTGRLAVVHEAVEFCGWGGEIAAWASEHCFDALDAPILRLGSTRSPVPFQERLEARVIPDRERVVSTLRELAAY